MPDPAADEVEVDAGVVGEPGGHGQRVGDHGEPGVRRRPGDRRRQAGHGTAGVEDGTAAVGELGEGGGRDAVLLVGGGGLALGEVRLEVEAAGRDGTAVHPADEAGPVQGLQVAAHGLRRDLELLGQGQDVDPAGLVGEAEDLLLALRCVHVVSDPFDARLCGFSCTVRPFPAKNKINGHVRQQKRTCPFVVCAVCAGCAWC